MSGRRAGPATGPERLTDLAELLEDDATRATFMRGLALGALVGAAIAGTLLGGRRRRRRRAQVAAAAAGLTDPIVGAAGPIEAAPAAVEVPTVDGVGDTLPPGTEGPPVAR